MRVFRQAQLVGTFPWPATDPFDVNVAKYFRIALGHRNVRPVSRVGQRTSIIPLTTIVPDAAGRAHTISPMLVRFEVGRARTRSVPGGTWIGLI